jgi:hypothetical protein
MEDGSKRKIANVGWIKRSGSTNPSLCASVVKKSFLSNQTNQINQTNEINDFHARRSALRELRRRLSSYEKSASQRFFIKKVAFLCALCELERSGREMR